MKFRIINCLILTAFISMNSSNQDGVECKKIQASEDFHEFFHRIIKKTDEYINRGERVLDKLPGGPLKNKIIHFVRDLMHFKDKLAYHFHHHHNIEFYEWKIEKILVYYKPWLEEAEELTKDNTTTTTTSPKTDVNEHTMDWQSTTIRSSN